MSDLEYKVKSGLVALRAVGKSEDLQKKNCDAYARLVVSYYYSYLFL